MKKLKDLDVHVIEDNSALTIKGGCEGEDTITAHESNNRGYWETRDWIDTGCC